MTKNKKVKIEMQIKNVEILNCALKTPTSRSTAVKTFNFNISIESKADALKKLVFVIVHVEIKNDDHSLVLGALSVSCIFEISNFEAVIKVKENGKLDIPPVLIETLNLISISTTRGVMFSTFKGTFLHGAVLPIIDSGQFNLE